MGAALRRKESPAYMAGSSQLLETDVANGVGGINYVDGVPHPDVLERFVNTDPTRVRIYYGA